MRLTELKNKGKKLKPLRDLVAFVWIKPTYIGKILIPDTFHTLGPQSGLTAGLRLGRFLFGKVMTVGPKVKCLKTNDVILIHEYGPINYEGTWEEDVVFFMPLKDIKAKVLDFKDSDAMIIDRKITKKMLDKYQADTGTEADFQKAVPKLR